MTDQAIWDYIIANKAVIYNKIYKHIWRQHIADVDEVFNISAILIHDRIKHAQDTDYFPRLAELSVLTALKKIQRDGRMIRYIEEVSYA